MTAEAGPERSGRDPLEELARRLERYPAGTYPVQHATAQFHLGVTLAGRGRLGPADAALEVACRLFRPDQLPVEHAKAANARGAVQRMAGQLDAAATSFERAAELFRRGGLALEEGAARFNLGLVERERDGSGAVAAFEAARALLDPEKVPAQAAAAARELGRALVSDGRVEQALPVLEEAVEQATRAGDRAGMSDAANVLGLAHLAIGRLADAVAALEHALAASPRRVRPEGYAMAKANLALAHEKAGATARARLAALQALGTPGAAEAVRAQAAEVAERTGAGPGAVWAVLDGEGPERSAAVVREELARWADARPADRSAEAAAWVEGQVARPQRAEDLAGDLLGALLELPADQLTLLVAALAAVERSDREAFDAQLTRAMARFPVPQLLRLEETFHMARHRHSRPRRPEAGD